MPVATRLLGSQDSSPVCLRGPEEAQKTIQPSRVLVGMCAAEVTGNTRTHFIRREKAVKTH